MLGRLRRTTRLDVGLALSFAGVAYLVWALVAGTTRAMVRDLMDYLALEGTSGQGTPAAVPAATRAVKVIFVDAGIAIDVAGLAWLAASLFLVVHSSRQRFSISWAWVSAMCQSLVAGLGGGVVSWAVHLPYEPLVERMQGQVALTPLEVVSGMSLPVVMVIALLIWVTFLVWLLVERARYSRFGPTLSDGQRTNVYR